MGIAYLRPQMPPAPPRPVAPPPQPWEVETIEEIQTKQAIKQLLHKEAELKMRAAQTLCEKFITDTTWEESPEVKAYEAAKARVDELFEKDAHAQGQGNMTGTHAAAARKLLAKLPQLEAEAIRHRRLYQIGNEVFAVRQEIKALGAKRDRLQADRLAGH